MGRTWEDLEEIISLPHFQIFDLPVATPSSDRYHSLGARIFSTYVPHLLDFLVFAQSLLRKTLHQTRLLALNPAHFE